MSMRTSCVEFGVKKSEQDRTYQTVTVLRIVALVANVEELTKAQVAIRCYSTTRQ